MGRVGGEGWYVARRLEGAEQIRRWFLRRDDASGAPPALPYGFEEVVTALAPARPEAARTRASSSGTSRTATSSSRAGIPARGSGSWTSTGPASATGPSRRLRRFRDLARPGLNRAEDLKLLLSRYFDPDPVPLAAALGVPALRRRIVLWDAFKARVRPWRK